MKKINIPIIALLLFFSCSKKVETDNSFVGEYTCTVERRVVVDWSNCQPKYLQISDTIVILKIEKYGYDGLLIHIPLPDYQYKFVDTITSLSNSSYPHGDGGFMIPFSTGNKFDLTKIENIISVFQEGSHTCTHPEYFFKYKGYKSKK